MSVGPIAGAALFLLVAFGASWVLTGVVRSHAQRNAIMDVPNYRSSHAVPTPRGGGLALAGVILVSLVVLTAGGVIPIPTATALAGGGALVAAVGWADDRSPRPAQLRLGVQLLASIWAVYWLNGLPSLAFGSSTYTLGLVGSVLAVLAIAWMTNLYNFMDGIDGIAGGEAVTVAAAAGVLLYMSGSKGLSLVALTICATSLGFLIWNWEPAKIFMGDVGSSLLGFLFGTLALASERSGAVPLVWWAVLLLVFILDSSVTLVRRALRRQRLDAAHRNHAYQRAVASGLSHAQVSGAVILLNLVLAGLVFVGLSRHGLAPAVALTAVALTATLYYAVERRYPMIPHRVPDPPEP